MAKTKALSVTPRQPAPPSKETNKYMRKLKEELLQPSNKHYGGMGYAKESVFLPLDDPDYDYKFIHIWEEHVPGFSGKSFKKRKRESEDGMLWKQRLKAKQCGITQQRGQATGITDNSAVQAKGNTGRDSRKQQVSCQASAKLDKGKKGKTQAAASKDQSSQLQSEVIAAYRQLKKAKRLQK